MRGVLRLGVIWVCCPVLKSLLLFIAEKLYICGMKMSERILRRVHPGRGDFGEDERSYVEVVLSAYNDERASSGRTSAMPVRYVPEGGEVTVAGRVLRCVRRGAVTCPADACSGCSLSRLYLGCADLQCSSFDRRDGINVWFLAEEGKRSL